jgi:DNA (cytosine-5)-methyltransferase 1
MRYGSVCSGIEAATVAWDSLRWEPVFFSEIEPFPSAVLAHHYPNVPNLGDMTKFKEWHDATIDVLVGGTPCQSFSVAGLRKGLDDPRGNLMLTYLAIAVKYRPKWVVWENVPGVLSSNGGRDFATFFRGLEECGYGVAYRILDAQYFGVAQRRRRVFVIGCLGSWQRSAAVLFERYSLQGNNPPSRKTGEEVAASLASSSGGCNDPNRAGAFIPTISECLRSGGSGNVPSSRGEHIISIGIDEECNASIDQFGPLLRGGQSGTRQAVATFDRQSSGEYGTQLMASTVSARDYKSASDLISVPHGFNWQSGQGLQYDADQCGTLIKNQVHAVHAVRRLTPVECERLQGFPDGYTNIPWRKKPESPDGPRYKALGNSMAVPCMEWIGERIQAVVSCD